MPSKRQITARKCVAKRRNDQAEKNPGKALLAEKKNPGTLDVLVANNPGKVVTVPYKNEEPIFFLLQRISDSLQENGTRIGRRDLFVNGIHAEDPRYSIEKYRIYGNALTYRSSGENGIMLFVRALSGKTLAILCDPLWKVSFLKELVHKRDNVPSESYTLTNEGRLLDEEEVLGSYGLGDCSTVHVVSRLPGGLARKGIQFVDVSDTSAVHICKTAKTGPRGYVCAPGTNIECQCECTPSHRVICQQDFGILELAETLFRCPNCEQVNKIRPITVGFHRCKYRFHGIKQNGEQYSSGWTLVTVCNEYQRFKPDNQIIWTRLVIESAKLDEVEDCIICLASKDEKLQQLECGHSFHEACYIQRGSSCPICSFNKHLLEL
ncbi:MAG: hypothetical protein J3Q66DRAFT_406830 [Benniella sp.]|nr:MAG: hypothetical protein J3Q66DRAFT_406830 [Benniella sp.]